MSNLSNSSFETVHAAATAIVNAQTRVQPSSTRVRPYYIIKVEILSMYRIVLLKSKYYVFVGRLFGLYCNNIPQA